MHECLNILSYEISIYINYAVTKFDNWKLLPLHFAGINILTAPHYICKINVVIQ